MIDFVITIKMDMEQLSYRLNAEQLTAVMKGIANMINATKGEAASSPGEDKETEK